jgi:hypothetical protein
MNDLTESLFHVSITTVVPILSTWTDVNIIAILLAVVAVGIGVGIIYYVLRNKNEKAATSPVSN